MSIAQARRAFLVSTTSIGAGLLIGCRRDERAEHGIASAGPLTREAGSGWTSDEGEVTATEDLMREHGVIRRALVVYREAAMRLTRAGELPADALQKTARLLRGFGQDYHEKKLEEKHIFPAIKRAGVSAAVFVDVLVAQHDRGRQINDYLIAAAGTKIASANVEPVVRALEGFARMYEAHAALEDTVIFPAWRKTMSAKQLAEMAELFEDIEHRTFGTDGFDQAVEQITAIEQTFQLDLRQFTPPPPERT